MSSNGIEAYKKNIGLVGSVSLLVSAITGPGLIAVPGTFQSAGWLPWVDSGWKGATGNASDTIDGRDNLWNWTGSDLQVFCRFYPYISPFLSRSLVSDRYAIKIARGGTLEMGFGPSLAGVLTTSLSPVEAISKYPGNAAFQRNVELTTLVQHFCALEVAPVSVLHRLMVLPRTSSFDSQTDRPTTCSRNWGSMRLFKPLILPVLSYPRKRLIGSGLISPEQHVDSRWACRMEDGGLSLERRIAVTSNLGLVRRCVNQAMASEGTSPFLGNGTPGTMILFTLGFVALIFLVVPLATMDLNDNTVIQFSRCLDATYLEFS
jgi:hypothetical protein